MIFIDVDTAVVVPVNVMPLIDDTDFKTRETAVAYNAAGMDLVWNFVTSAGVVTQTAVTPTTSGSYDWAHAGDGMYTIEIPASGGASINNDTEGYGYFSGVATGVLPWRGPTICFRAAGLNNLLCDDAFSATRGLAGTALPNAAADAAGGLVISDAGGLDADAQRADVAAILVDTGTTLDGRIPAALVGGRMDSSVGAMAANTLTASAVAADAVTELQAGLSTLDAAGVRTAVGLASANLDTQLDALPTAAENTTAVWAAGTRTLTAFGFATGLATAAALSTAQTDISTILTTVTKLDTTLVLDGAVYQFTANALELGPSGAGSAVVELRGVVTKSGSTYYVSFVVIAAGAVIAGASLSSLVLTVYDEDGTDLTFSGTPTAHSTGIVYASGTLGTAPIDNRPIIVKIGATYSGTAYSSVLSGVNLA